MPRSEGEKGEVTFSLRRRSRRSFAGKRGVSGGVLEVW